MYFFLGISLFFAFLLALNFFVSLAASAVWRVLKKPAQNWSARRRTQVIFGLRVFPFLAALVFVFAFLLPAYLLFEPHSSEETVTAKLAIPAIVSLIGITAALCRVFVTYLKTSRLIKSWLRNSEPIFLENIKIPVYRIAHPFPVIAVVGAFRPKMFVAEQIFSSLDTNEIKAAIAHECGHLAAHDNFKRTLLRICRDLLVFPMGNTLDRAWAENAESAADEFAAQKGGTQTALDLAAALVKIVRIVPINAAPTMPLGAFLIEKQSADITSRVRHLIQIAGNLSFLEARTSNNFQIIYKICLAASFISILILATNQTFLFRIHTILENIVAILQ